MTNEEILKKVIDKAVDNGFTLLGKDYEETIIRLFHDQIILGYSDAYVYAIIFTHEFAKAFWGDEKVIVHPEHTDDENWFNCDDPYVCCQTGAADPAWEYHLQKIVLEQEPLKYLEKFL